MVRSLFLLLLWRRLAFSRVILLVFFLDRKKRCRNCFQGIRFVYCIHRDCTNDARPPRIAWVFPRPQHLFQGLFEKRRMIMQIMHRFYDKSLARYRYQQKLYLQATFRTTVDSMMLYEDLFIRIEPTRLVEPVHFTGLPRVVPFFLINFSLGL